MATIIFTIAAVDRTNEIQYESVVLNRALTSQVDTLQFKITRADNTGYKPSVLDTVTMSENGTTIFSGSIVDMSVTNDGGTVETFECACRDHSFTMDRKLVVATYTSQTVDYIIADIISNFTTGFTGTNVDCIVVLNYIAFNYEYPSKCLQQLAELLNYDWYVDVNKDIHFFSKSTTVAPFELDDTSGKYYYNSLRLDSDAKNLRNTIIVRGGEYQGTITSETVIADGTALVYKQGMRYNNVTVTVNGVSKTVGIDNIDDPTTKDCLYNFTEKFIRFKAGTLPAVSHAIVVGGNPYIPVIVKVKDPASVALYGEFQYKVVDKSINSKEAARDRAKAEIIAWADTVNEGQFDTVEAGLDVGQRIHVTSTLRAVDNYYVISRITTRFTNSFSLLHTCVLMTSQTFGMIEFLQKLLIQKDKEIEIKEGEVTDEVEAYYEDITVVESTLVSTTLNPVSESMTVGESTTVQSLNYAVEFCVGEQAPSSVKRQFVLDGSILA